MCWASLNATAQRVIQSDAQHHATSVAAGQKVRRWPSCCLPTFRYPRGLIHAEQLRKEHEQFQVAIERHAGKVPCWRAHQRQPLQSAEFQVKFILDKLLIQVNQVLGYWTKRKKQQD